MRRIILLEFRRSSLSTVLPLLVFLTGLAAWRNLLPGVWTWESTSLARLASIQLLGPVAAGLAAWAATRERRRRLGYLRQLSVGKQGLAPAVQAGSLALVVCLAVLVVDVTLTTTSLLERATGTPDFFSHTVALAGAAMFTVAGYSLGFLVPHAPVPPVVCLLAYIYVVLNLDFSGSWFYLLAPVTVERPNVFVSVAAGLFASQTAWLMLATAVILLVLVAAAVRSKSALILTATVAVASTGAAVNLGRFDGHVFGAQLAPVDYTCADYETAPKRICLERSFADANDGLHRAFATPARRLGAANRPIQELAHLPRTPGQKAPAAGTYVLHLDDLSAGFQQRAVSEFQEQFFDRSRCFPQDPAVAPDDGAVDAYLRSMLLALWIAEDLQGVQVPERAERYQEVLLATAEQRTSQWLAEVWPRFQTCQLTDDDYAKLGV